MNLTKEKHAKPMSKQTDNDMVPRIALGLTVFLAMKLAPRVFAWWNKRKDKTI